MKLARLVIPPLAIAGAAWAWKRFVIGPEEGHAETESARPYSSEQLGYNGEPAAPADGAQAPEEGVREDPLTHPTWLKPGDSN